MSPASALLQQRAGQSDHRLRWWPMVFSVFGLLIPNGLLMRGHATTVEWVFACIGALAFVLLCGVAVVSWQRNKPFLWVVLLLEGLGAAYVPVVYSATIFFALAAHILPWAVRGDIRRTVFYGTPLVILVLAGYWLVPEHGVRWINSALYYGFAMAGQVWVVRMALNMRRLAEVAERQRIGNELNDVLGDALSKITLKAQLAIRLLEESGDCDRARNEVAATERICRSALADVRQTIRAYREEARAEQGRMNAAD